MFENGKEGCFFKYGHVAFVSFQDKRLMLQYVDRIKGIHRSDVIDVIMDAGGSESMPLSLKAQEIRRLGVKLILENITVDVELRKKHIDYR